MKLFNLRSAKRNVLLLMMLLMAAVAGAVPAKPGLTRILTKSDGTTVTARLVGDEHGHFWLGQDGKSYTVGNEGVASVVDAEAIKAKASVRRQQANARRAKRLAPRKVGEVGSITGQKKGLIILVNFKGTSFKSANNNALYQRIANEVNFSYGDFKGSMYDYFYAQSDGQFQLTFDVVGPVTVSNTQSYYGGNDSNGDDLHPGAMVIEALLAADSSVNYADYDWDGDGEVEQVYVVYAGQGEADGGSANTIWPHEWELSSAAQYGDGSGAQTLDGVTIDTYACGGELNGSGNIAGIGTMCHEFSHCLGYPDFYDTDYSGGQGMFEWDLMDSGSYNDDGYRPAGYTSYERWVAGWREPIELTSTQQISNMPALVNSGAQSYIIYNQGNRNEYFLLENRQKTGWDTDVPGAGLLILHVDYNETAWSSNTPNDTPSHQRMTWIAADNEYQYTTYQGSKYYTTSGAANDPFPYGSVNAFNKSTTPAAKFYNKNSDNTYYLDSSIENITQNSNGTVSFKFVGVSNVATPTFSPKAGRYSEAQTVTISCETSGSTIYYTLDGTAPTTSSSVYSQPLTISETTTVKAIAVADGEESATATAKYTIGQSTSNPDATTFRLVSSVDDLEPGMRYIIACGSKATAAGALNSTYLGNVSVTVSNDVITIGSGVAVFVLEGDQDTGWTFQNESTDEYLYATAAKSVKYSSDEELWTLSNGNDGVVMTYGSFGTMLYNSSSPRFTTYTSTPTTSMIQANLYMEESSAMPTIPEPFIVAEESLTFSTTVGTPATKTFEVLTEGLTEDVTLTLSDANNVFSLGQNTIGSTVADANVSVTFSPTTAGTFTATVTLISAGAEPATVTLTGTATDVTTPVDPTGGETLLYEGVSDYSSENDGTQPLTTSSSYLDYSGWIDLTKVFAGGTSNSYKEGEGGCLKLGSGSAIGSLTTGSLAINGNATLTFYLKKYSTDTGNLNVTVTGATADVTQFTPSSSWTQCTVNLTNGNGQVTITFATTSKRAYLDEITLITAGGDTPVQKEDITLTFTPSQATATLGETFTAPVLTIEPDDLSVTYSSSNEQVATVDAQTGAVTLVAEGSTVITASFAGNDNYNPAEASYTLTIVSNTTGNGSQDSPYTVADVNLLFANNQVPADNVYVQGIVSQITEFNTTYHNATYYISDNGTTTDQFFVFRGKYLNGEDFTSGDQLQEGDAVVVYGTLTTYNTTNEFAKDNYLVSLVRPAVTLDQSAATVEEGSTVSLTATVENASGATVTWMSDDEDVATVSDGVVTGVAAGTATITASITANGHTYSATCEVTVTSATNPDDPTGGEILLYEGVSGYTSAGDGSQALTASSGNLDYSGWSDLTKVYAGGTTKAYPEGDGGCLKLGTGSAIGSITTGSLALSGNGTLTFYLKQYGTDTGKLNVWVEGAVADVTQFTPSSSWTQCIVNLIDGNGQVTITFATTSKRAYLDEITLITAGGDTPVQKEDIDLQFTEPMATANLDEPFTAPELIIEPSDLAVTYSSSNEQVATVDAQTGVVTLVAEGTTVITASFAGDDDYNPAEASYTLTVSSGTTPVDPTGGETLLYEGLSGYDISSDSSTALETDDDNLDYSGWDSFTKVYAGGMSNSYIQGEGGCLKLGSSKAEGSMTTGTLAIEGKATLTFYLKKYGTDSGVLNVTVTGATADVTQFTLGEDWTQCTVNLTHGTGEVTITFTTSGGRAYMDEIKVITVSNVPVPGDVDDNGTPEDADLQLLVDYLLGKPVQGVVNPDVDGDGEVSLKDVTKLVNIMQGLE